MRIRSFLLASLIVIASTFGLAQSDAPTYQKPPQAIVDIMDAPPLPGVAVSPLRDVIALVPRRSMPSIAELAQPWIGLAGSRINPSNNGPQGAPAGTGVILRKIATGAESPIRVPADAHIALVGFSPDGKRLAFTDTRDTRVDLYVADVATGATRVADAALNTIVGGCGWLTDSSGAAAACAAPAASVASATPAPTALLNRTFHLRTRTVSRSLAYPVPPGIVQTVACSRSGAAVARRRGRLTFTSWATT